MWRSEYKLWGQSSSSAFALESLRWFSALYSGVAALRTSGNAFVSDTHSVIGVLRLQMLTLLRLAFTWLFGFWILAASDFTQPRGEFSC